MIAYTRHHQRDKEILPQARELFVVMREYLGIDLYPPSLRQVALCVRLVRRYSRLINDFQYLVPASLDEALGSLDRYREDAEVLAGDAVPPEVTGAQNPRLPDQSKRLVGVAEGHAASLRYLGLL